jgi:hypothetical protein
MAFLPHMTYRLHHHDCLTPLALYRDKMMVVKIMSIADENKQIIIQTKGDLKFSW